MRGNLSQRRDPDTQRHEFSLAIAVSKPLFEIYLKRVPFCGDKYKEKDQVHP